MSELPDSWTAVPLTSVCEFIRGVTYTKDVVRTEPTNDYLPILRATNLQGRALVLDELVYVPSHLVSERQRLQTGDVVIATSSGSISVVGKAVQIHRNLHAGFGAFCGVLRPSAHVEHQYFGHFFSSDIYRSTVSAMARGVNINNLKREHFDALTLPLPPFSEQQRIVAKLNTLLGRMDSCRERLERVGPLIKRFRQAVLAAAVTGQLTEDWRNRQGTVEAASDLLDQLRRDHDQAGGYARGNASPPTTEAHDLGSEGMPNSWCVVTMLDACEPGRPITYGILKPGPEQADGVPYVRVADFPGNRLRLETIRKTSAAIDEQFRRARLRPGDLLLSIRGSVGRVIEVPDELLNANITQDTARLTISQRLDRRYVLIALLEEGMQERMRNATRGVAVRGINIGDVRALQLPLPPRSEQSEIARRVEAFFAVADRLEARLAAAQSAVRRLTPTLLAKAFRGELVPQDPDDEPAEILLERIREQQAAATKPARTARRTHSAAA